MKNILVVGKHNNDYWKICCYLHSKTIDDVKFIDGLSYDDLDDKTKEQIYLHMKKKPWWRFWA